MTPVIQNPSILTGHLRHPGERTAVKGLTVAFRRFTGRLPETVDRRVAIAAWVSLVAQIAIVGTGGAVRLTGSGLGCPTWPLCTAGSLVNTPEMGIHGVIEFGNRLLTVALVVIVVVMFLLVVRMRRTRPDLVRLAFLLGLGIPAQAVLGGITVLTGLNSWIVGAHFLVSIVLVVLATMLVSRVRSGPGSPESAVPRSFRTVALLTSVTVAVTVAVGVVTTGSGPHAGDANTPRNGLDPAILQHVHSWPAYLTLGLTLLLLVMASVGRLTRVAGPVRLLLGVEVVQIVVGITQSRLGLPPLLVGVHMVLACVLVAAMTAVVLATRTPARDVVGTDVAVDRRPVDVAGR